MKLFFSFLFLALFSDLFTKWIAVSYLKNTVSLFFPLQFILSKNSGIALSLPLPFYLQIILSFLLLVYLFFFLQKHPTKNHFIFCGMIFGGAFGNIFERIFFLEVTDFIQFFPGTPICNIADLWIFFGVCGILFSDHIIFFKK